ncbi:MAG: YdjY domain-containing protein [Verrucomicrobiales bacterium]|jgi:hypothetical protein|nr:YdjY domain-containing protein [Verrucomicrobiales bacterium]MDB2347436.1 YdjY domain-containing protein [Verrucomicrobiales bacterium]
MAAPCSFTFLSLVALTTMALGQFGGGPEDAPDDYGGSPKRAADASLLDQSNRAKHASDAKMLVLPGLLANKEIKRVSILAEATGLEAETVIEFLLIDQSCGRGYESLLWSFAKPSDVHRALEFIGMKSGTPFHPEALQFWPKGERVVATVLPENDGTATKPMRLEKLIYDKETGTTMEETGLVFTGSYRIPEDSSFTPGAYAADVIEPKSIGSIFNHRLTVLDLPVRAPKHDVYGKRLVNPDVMLRKHQLVTLTLEPERKDGQRRTLDLQLAFTGNQRQPTVLNQVGDKTPLAAGELVNVLASFEKLSKENRDVFVQLDYRPELTLSDAQRFSRLIKAIDTDQGIRVEPPKKGQLFYEAFCPRDDMLDRKARYAHPWELELSRNSEQDPQGKLLLYESEVSGDEDILSSQSWKVTDRAALKNQIAKLTAARADDTAQLPIPNVLFVHAMADFLYRDVMNFIDGVLPEPSTIYVFVKKP